MKVSNLRRLCAFLLLLLTLCACTSAEQTPDEPPDPDPVTDPDQPETAPDEPDQPETQPAQEVYFFIHDVFAGSLTPDGMWRSVSDTSLSFEADEAFALGELFGQSCYTWYGADGQGMPAGSFSVFIGNGPGGFYPSRVEDFASYALESNSLGDARFTVPTELPSELSMLQVPDYGFSMHMSSDDSAVLTASTDRDLCPGGMSWRGGEDGGDVTQQESDAVQALLQQNDIASSARLQALDVDYDGDGQIETFVFAASPRGEDGYPPDGTDTVFSAVLLMDGQTTETVYTRIRPYSPDNVLNLFHPQPAGTFDLDGDGVYELCMTEVYWESAAHFALKRQPDGSWEIVLAGVSGT